MAESDSAMREAFHPESVTNREKLEKALALLLEVRATLNTKEAACSCCGLTKKENWAEHQLGERLKGMTGKLRDIVEGFEKRSPEYRAAMAHTGHKTEEGT